MNKPFAWRWALVAAVVFSGNVAAGDWHPLSLQPQAVDLGYCLSVARGQAPPDAQRCPDYVIHFADLAEADKECREFHGTLQPQASSALYRIDIDGDGQPEYLFEFNSNFFCDNAASLFICGSSPCPLTMYRRDATATAHGADGWRELGWFPLESDFSARPRADAPAYPDLRVHCNDDQCDPLRYAWDGGQYTAVERTVRGVAVTLFEGGSKLITSRHPIPIYGAPQAGSPVLYTADTGSYFTVMGEVDGSDFVAAMACNACEEGFVHKSDLDMR